MTPEAHRGPPALVALEAVAAERRSVRAFRPARVDETLIERAVMIARNAPSSCNTQPWRIEIVSDAVLDRLRRALTEAASSGLEADYDVAPAAPYTGELRSRQIEAAIELYRALGIERHDRDGRRAAALDNFNFFGAPYAAFIFMPAGAGLREASDCGQFVHAFILGLSAAGIASCVQGALSSYGGIVRSQLGMGDDQRLFLGISFGLADEEHASAAVQTSRRALDDILGRRS
ncbi:nitroreductase [Brevundimonas diminuta]|uniref:nitroreductase n=1 Tax=Brevundimonas diminuta TaxID=293 RepID=UPI0030F7D7FF